MKYLAGILILLFAVMGVQADCPISQYMVENTNRIFTYRDDRGALQLLRAQPVPSGLKLYMFCNEQDVLETECQDNGSFSVALPMSCSSPMKTTVMKDGRNSDCPQTLYIVGYKLEGQQLELYRSCYDGHNGRALYSQSDVYFKKYFAKRPWVDFDTDQIVKPIEAAAYMKHRMYDEFQLVFGKKQQYLPSARELVINRGHLVPSADFLFCDQMASTFRYINVVPQFKSINDGNWEKIERWLRDQVTVQQPFRIRTGGIDILRLQDENGNERSACLANDKLPVPKWIYKVVRDTQGNGLYAFLSYNNIFERQRPPVLSTCQSVACPFTLPDNPNAGFIYCCNPTNFPY
ncbi:hypothetical protein AWZ03_003348 [Drosophila navojoa]|uniref:DNA/RNA non-specific endonuclease/pyrophosphatase/phosphodiesterase domain-containing protein n=1 Tax=Drosophila navojoa TaxID=7232 RepID=A0A484BPI9_DRONA|nr:uncharacterized protein LOC108653735 [Drosophila navojoa]TDG50132.1 hypothetical protein AWZ03_003348 [Drosophila navojoa]